MQKKKKSVGQKKKKKIQNRISIQNEVKNKNRVPWRESRSDLTIFFSSSSSSLSLSLSLSLSPFRAFDLVSQEK